MEEVQIILTLCSLFISLCTVATLIYGFGKFLAKPHDTLEQRVTVLEVKQQEMEREKDNLSIRCKEQDETNEVMINCVLALIEYEIQYCISEKKELSDGLKDAKHKLHQYLSKK